MPAKGQSTPDWGMVKELAVIGTANGTTIMREMEKGQQTDRVYLFTASAESATFARVLPRAFDALAKRPGYKLTGTMPDAPAGALATAKAERDAANAKVAEMAERLAKLEASLKAK